MVGRIVSDIREQAVHARFSDDDMAAVVPFHDEAEQLWTEMMATNPPLSPAEVRSRIVGLLERCRGPLDQFEPQLQRGLQLATDFAAQAGEADTSASPSPPSPEEG